MGETRVYDMIVVGGGPGGYTAALYAARAGLDTLVLEKLSAGGQMALTEEIDNYPGYEDGIDGFTLAEKMQRQAERFGAQTAYAQVERMELTAAPKALETSEGTFYARTVVLATGANPRELGLAGEEALVGRGVAYCAACDGMRYKGKTVAVVGGGNSAAGDALLLSRIAERVVLVHRRDQLRATKIYHEPLIQAENVEFRWNSTVTELLHEEKLTGIRLRDVQTGAESVLPCDGLFISVGRKPATELVKGQLELDAGGYVTADETTRTNLPGVYAVGDVRTKPLRQVVTAVADGAMAVHMAEEYLAGGAGSKKCGRERLKSSRIYAHLVQNAGIRDAGGLKRTQLPGVSDGTDSSGQFLYPCFAERQATEKEPVMRQTARSGGALWAGSSVLFQQPSDF